MSQRVLQQSVSIYYTIAELEKVLLTSEALATNGGSALAGHVAHVGDGNASHLVK